MPAATEVRPADWSEIIVLYDDGVYSVIWGRFRRRPYKDLGARYNVGDNPGGRGYPSLGGHPLWYVEPSFLIESILVGLRQQLLEAKRSNTKFHSQNDAYLRNIEIALRQAKQQGKLPTNSDSKTPPVRISSQDRSTRDESSSERGSLKQRSPKQRSATGRDAHAPTLRAGWKGHWFFNTNETHSPGAYRKMFARNVAAIYGYPNGPRNLQGARAGDRIFAYVNQEGLRAVGVVIDGEVVPGSGIFVDGRGKQLPNEFHLKVRWEAIVPPGKAISAKSVTKVGRSLPVRSTFGKLYDGKVAVLLEEELRARSRSGS
jgi:hypothetical protein